MLARRDELHEEDPPIEALKVWTTMRDLRLGKLFLWRVFGVVFEVFFICFLNIYIYINVIIGACCFILFF